MQHPETVSRAQWLEARLKLLEREKQFTRERDALSAARRALPRVRIDTPYVFDTPDGQCTLPDLFDGVDQLMVYHFMFDEDWETGCKSCSFWADNYNGVIEHLRARNVAFAAVSKAPLTKLEAFRARMGWRFRWVSSPGNVFGRDFGVSFTPEEVESEAMRYNFGTMPAFLGELPGMSVFMRDPDGAVYHTYSCYARGLDMLNGAYHHLDIAPRGRDEDGFGFPMEWVRLRDEYGA